MAHTHTNLIFHVVFATQGFLPLIKPEHKHECRFCGTDGKLQGKLTTL